MKLAAFAPAGTVTDGGIVAAAVFPLERFTTTPPAEAAPAKVTVPVEIEPPATDAGLTENADSAGGLTVKISDLVTPLYTAETVAVAATATVPLVKETFAVVAPAGTVTVAGTGAIAVFVVVRLTIMPPAGAAPVSVTVALDT